MNPTSMSTSNTSRPIPPILHNRSLSQPTFFSKQEVYFTDNLFETFLNFDVFSAIESSDYRCEEFENRGICKAKNGNYNSESEAENCAIDGEKFTFCEKSKRSKNFSSDCDLMDEEFSLEFGSVDFSGTELKKIMADKRLEKIALADPKLVKRILANRCSAARSKERKMRYILELESKVKSLQAEAAILSAKLALLQEELIGLASQNNELNIRLQGMELQAELKDALNEALTAEVQRMRLS